ncbi:MAG TPA: hypothetical protein VG389_04535 [Myxococcota bacterium]|jgi:hypothetical protein|nr:hypothetical protein [Myxococcota bacterium]
MPQVTEFPAFPGVRPDDYVERLVQVLTFVRDFHPTQRAVREWAATMGFWDKEQFARLFALFDVSAGAEEKLAPGPWASGLLEKPSLDLQKDEVFKRIFTQNELLVKFCFVQIKDRVQGTEPLYRLVTSFSYRGEKPNLPSFTAWVQWVAGCGYLRKLGVAWGLSSKAEMIFKLVESVDEEEILKEQAAQQKAQADLAAGAAAGEGGAGEAAAGAAAGASRRAPGANGGGAPAGDDEDDFGDDASEATAASGAGPRAAGGGAGVTARGDGDRAAGVAAGAGSGARSAPAPAVARIVSPVQFRPVEHPPLEVGDAALTVTLGRVMELWRARPAGPFRGVPRATDVGLSAAEYKAAKKPYFVFRVACLGAIHYRARLAPGASAAAYRALEAAGVFKELFVDNVVLEDVLGTRGYFVQQELERAASRALVEVLPLRTALHDGGAKAVKALEGAADGDALLETLDALAGRTLDVELFFVARELHELKLWGDAAGELAVVPDRPTRDQAFRLGFIDSPYAHDLGELRDQARQLQKWFGRGEAYGLPLLALEHSYGCAYRCTRADTCEYTCRERYELGRK